MDIYIVDSIMGSGKTSASITKMLEDTESNYIYITPFLKEVDRVKEKCWQRKFVEPENNGIGKLESLRYLIGKDANIASTHALFKVYDDDIRELIRNKNYKLIMDEVFGVLEIIPLHKDDINLLLDTKAHVDEDNYVVWDDAEYDGKRFADIKMMAENHNLMLVDGVLMLWNFPIEIFACFKEVYVLTYMFDAQIQKYYYDINNVELKYLGVRKDGDRYTFSDVTTIPDYVPRLKEKINIVEDEKLNCIGDKYTALSVSWFDRDKAIKGKPLIKILKKNLNNVFKNYFKSASDDNMWTTYKEFQTMLAGKGYTKGFVSVNARATNDYRNKKYLAYCANIFLNPYLKKYFVERGINVLEEDYALSEMIQWIWRSTIREDNPINIYVPSSRMRNLLKNWLSKL